MRRPLLFGIFFSLALFGSLKANADQPLRLTDPAMARESNQKPSPAEIAGAARGRTDISWHVLADVEKAIIDKMAADFFEKSLRLSQSRQIEAATPAIYRALTPREKARFRAERREAWRAMSARQQHALRKIRRPRFDNLAEVQKLPFRQNAIRELSASGAINAKALTAALKLEI